MISFSCPACGGQSWRPWRQPAHAAAFIRCVDCGLGRIDPMPTSQELAQTFDDGYFSDGGSRGGYHNYDVDSEIHRRNARARMDRIDRQRTTQPGAAQPILVDVGCASGYTLEAARDRGWQAAGVEVSPRVAQTARDKGFRVVEDLSALLQGPDSLAGSVAVVSFFQVLEHLPDPVTALRLASELLVPGGIVVCETWDPDSAVAKVAGDRWQQLSPSVLWVFGRPSMGLLFAEQRLSLRRWTASTKWVSVGLVTGQLMPRFENSPAAVRNAADRALAPLAKARVPYGLGDLVTVSAVRAPR